jgi:hypothetical protein
MARGVSDPCELMEGGQVFFLFAVGALIKEFRISIAVKCCLQAFKLLLWHHVTAADFAVISMLFVSMGCQQLPEGRHEALEIHPGGAKESALRACPAVPQALVINARRIKQQTFHYAPSAAIVDILSIELHHRANGGALSAFHAQIEMVGIHESLNRFPEIRRRRFSLFS